MKHFSDRFIHGCLLLLYYISYPFVIMYDFVKRHWKGAVSGIALVVVTAVLFITIRNNVHRQVAIKKSMFYVNQFIRNLPEGQHHSVEKAKAAAELGIKLKTSQTIVNPHYRTR